MSGLIDDVIDDVVSGLVDDVVSGWRHSMEAWVEGIAGRFAPQGFAQRPSRTAGGPWVGCRKVPDGIAGAPGTMQRSGWAGGGSGARVRLGPPTIGTWWTIPGLDSRVR